MKYRKIQSEIFKMLQSEGKVYKYQVSENEIAVIDGIKAFVLPTSIINFNLEKCGLNDGIAKYFKSVENAQKMIVTSDLKVMKARKLFARKFTCDNFDLWLNNSWLDYFDNAEFWATSPFEPVRVYEKINRKDVLVGILMPIRMIDEEGKNNEI